MALLRDQGDLPALCGQAGESLGLPHGVVEKDYWVTQALRALQVTYPGEFIFKGGTSLSKGFALIQRFSEDIDILVHDDGTAGKKAKYDRLKTMTQTAAQAVGDGASTRRGGGDDGTYRIELLQYGPETEGPALMLPQIRLDIGVLGGVEPHGMRPIGTLLGDVLRAERDIDIMTFDDLVPFEVPVLHPGRTLVEKLLLVHTSATRSVTDPQLLLQYRASRHYYDIHCLLGHDECCDLLADRDQFDVILADAVAISTIHFGGVEPRPDDGFAASLAFCATEPLVTDIVRQYEDTMSAYYFGTNPHPSYDGVCERVDERRELL